MRWNGRGSICLERSVSDVEDDFWFAKEAEETKKEGLPESMMKWQWEVHDFVIEKPGELSPRYRELTCNQHGEKMFKASQSPLYLALGERKGECF